MASNPNRVAAPSFDEAIVVVPEAGRRFLILRRANGQEVMIELTDAQASTLATALTA